MTIISNDFYERNTLEVAKSLLGCVLCRRTDDEVMRGVIVETEAYTQDEPSCHAYRGRTKRSETLFKKPGLAYIYFIYGMYHCMNVVTEKEGRGCAVLIRALEPVENLDDTNGPGKLCREMQITRELNEADLTSKKSNLWIEKGSEIQNTEIIQTVRIGIKQAVDYRWRFYVKNSKWVSKK